MARLKSFYKEKIASQMKKKLDAENIMQVPRISKITLNMGIGGAGIKDKKAVSSSLKDLEIIAGQKPVATRARKSIAGFKIREGWTVGAKVTLRGNRMYEFLDRLISIVIPRIRDFRGLSPRSFDGRGNYSMGIREQIAFPEIDYDKIDKIRGLDITITTTSKNDEISRELLKAFNFPLKS